MKTKRTYNISAEAVATVKRLVEERHVAASQDALVEQAITEFARRVRDADDARVWEKAASDPAFTAEVKALDVEYARDESRNWEA